MDNGDWEIFFVCVAMKGIASERKNGTEEFFRIFLFAS